MSVMVLIIFYCSLLTAESGHAVCLHCGSGIVRTLNPQLPPCMFKKS